jgi:precorrin-6A/cobalt-precorrin-6A reductase
MRVLLLGGTTEAAELARALGAAGTPTLYSLAGRTERPVAPPVPWRVGGFGGIAGLVEALRAEGISHVVDATHPFARQMSRHAVAACAALDLPLIGFERPPWVAMAGDRWTSVADIAAAVAALPAVPARIFLAIGRQEAPAFALAPQHHYLLRLVDPGPVAALPGAEAVVARGPFTVDGDLALMRRHGTEVIVAKNAGGEGARAKLDAARILGLPVILIDRPPAAGPRVTACTVQEVMDWLAHHPARRGV